MHLEVFPNIWRHAHVFVQWVSHRQPVPASNCPKAKNMKSSPFWGVVRLEKYEKSLGENYVGLGSLFLRDEECFSLYSDIGAIPSLTLRFFYPPLPKPWPIFSSAMVIFQFAELTQPRLGSKPSQTSSEQWKSLNGRRRWFLLWRWTVIFRGHHPAGAPGDDLNVRSLQRSIYNINELQVRINITQHR